MSVEDVVKVMEQSHYMKRPQVNSDRVSNVCMKTNLKHELIPEQKKMKLDRRSDKPRTDDKGVIFAGNSYKQEISRKEQKLSHSITRSDTRNYALQGYHLETPWTKLLCISSVNVKSWLRPSIRSSMIKSPLRFTGNYVTCMILNMLNTLMNTEKRSW